MSTLGMKCYLCGWMYKTSFTHWSTPSEPTCRKMRSMICASLISDTMRISWWHWGHSSGSTSQTFLISSRQDCDGVRRGLRAGCSMISIAALASAPHPCCAVAADSHAASSCASSSRFLRWRRILLEYQP